MKDNIDNKSVNKNFYQIESVINKAFGNNITLLSGVDKLFVLKMFFECNY